MLTVVFKHEARFWILASLLACVLLLASWLIIANELAKEKSRLIHAMQARADAIVWAIEGGARFFHSGNGVNLSLMLAEIGRQPAVAWIAIVAADGKIILDSNPELAGALLYTRGELQEMLPGAGIQGRFSPDDPDIYETWRIFQPERLKGRKGFPFRHDGLDGKYIFVALDAAHFHASTEAYLRRLVFMAALINIAILCIVTLLHYARGYRQSRRQLKDTMAFATQVLESYPTPLLVASDSGAISFYNDLARKMFAISNSGKNLSLEDFPYLDWDGIRRELEGGSPVLERDCELLFPQGEHPVSLSAARIPASSHGAPGYLFVFRDLAEITLLKKQVAQSRRLSALGELAAGLAHEIRNPLSSICGYAHYLESRLETDPMGKATARLLEEEAQRLNGVLADLLSVAKPAKPCLKKCSPMEIASKVYRLAKPDADAKGIDLKLQLPATENHWPHIDGDKIIQALLNLTLNAIQATPSGGEVEISVAFRARPEVNGGAANMSPHWNLTVRDTGPGMPEKIKNQIFTPYFTTRANGTGLGLTIARQIVESHGGAILVHSLPGRGTSITIVLPEHQSRQNNEKSNHSDCG